TVYTQANTYWNQSLANTRDTTNLQSASNLFAQVINQSPYSVQGIQSRWYMGQVLANLYVRLRRANVSDEMTRQSYLQGAVEALMEYVSLDSTSANAPRALKQIGDCQHVLSKYHSAGLWKAANAYHKVFTDYSTSDIAPE